MLGVVIKNNYGAPLFGINNRLVPGFEFDERLALGTDRVPTAQSAADARHLLDRSVFRRRIHTIIDVIYDAVTFEVVASDVFGSGKLPEPECGSMYWPATWTHTPAGAAVTVKAD